MIVEDTGPENLLANKLGEYTKQKLALWLRPVAAYSKAYCFIEQDLIEFDLYGLANNAIFNIEDTKLIVATYRNVQFIWDDNTAVESRELIMKLLSASEVNLNEIEQRKATLKAALIS